MGRAGGVVAPVVALVLALALASSPTAAANGGGPDIRLSLAAGDDTLPYLFIGPDLVPVAAWTGPDGASVVAQVPLVGTSSGGTPLEGVPPPTVPAPVDGTPDRVAMDADGDIHTVWQDATGAVWHRVFDIDGAALGPAHRMSAVDSVATAPAIVAAAPDGETAAWVAWVESRAGLGVHVRLVSIDFRGSILTSRLVDQYSSSMAPYACDVAVDSAGLPHVTFVGEGGGYWALPTEHGGGILHATGTEASLPLVVDLGGAGTWAVWLDQGALLARHLEGESLLGEAVDVVAAGLLPSLPRATDPATVAAGGPAAVLVVDGGVHALVAGASAGSLATSPLLTPAATASQPLVALDGRGQSYAVWSDAREGSLDVYAHMLARAPDVALEGPVWAAQGMAVPVRPGGALDAVVDVHSVVGYRTEVALEVSLAGGSSTFTAQLVTPSGLVLDPGSTEAAVVRITASSTAKPGTSAYFELTVHPVGHPEAGTSLVLGVEVPADVPFVIRGPQSPVAALPGEAVSVGVTLESWSDRDQVVRLGTDAPAGWTFAVPNEVELGAGETVDVTVEVTAPIAMSAGALAPLRILGSTDDGVEGRGTVIAAVVQPHAGVSVQLALASVAVVPGGVVDVDARVRNTGNLPLDLVLATRLEHEGWTASVEPSAVALAPGSEASLVVRVSAPPGTPFLSGCTIFLEASEAGGQPLGSALLRASAARVVDYRVEAFPTPTPVFDGEARVEVRVRNLGNAAETLDVMLVGLPSGWYASSPGLLGRVTVGPGETLARTLVVTVPGGADAGTTALSVVADGPHGPVGAGLELVVPSEFRAVLQSAAPVAMLTPPGSVTFPITVLGLGNIGGNAHMAMEGLPPTWDYAFQTLEGLSATAFVVEAGGRAETVLAVKVPEGATGDAHELTVLCRDQRGLVLDRLVVHVRLRFPDLALEAPTFTPPTPRAGEPVTVRVRVLNIGGADAEDVVVLLKEGDRVLDRDTFTLVPRGSYREAVFYFVPSEGRRTLVLHVDPSESIPELTRTNNVLIRRIDVEAPARAPLVSPEVAAISVSVAVTASIIGLLGGTEVGRYALWAALLLPLYTKLMKDRVLDHYLRGKIHGYIIANPGEHYNAIKDQLDVTNGALSYHLRVLEREGYIRSRMDGMYKRFYPSEMKLPRTTRQISSFQEVILTIVKNNQGLSQKDIAKRIGVSSQVINYHIKLLEDSGLIKVDRSRRKSRVYATDAPAGHPELLDMASEQA